MKDTISWTTVITRNETTTSIGTISFKDPDRVMFVAGVNQQAIEIRDTYIEINLDEPARLTGVGSLPEEEAQGMLRVVMKIEDVQ